MEEYHVPQQSRRDKLRIMSAQNNNNNSSTSSLLLPNLYDPSSFMNSMAGLAYLDPQSSLHINPSSIQDMNNNPFLYTPQNLQNIRDFDHQSSCGAAITAGHQHQALSLSLSSHHHHRNNILPMYSTDHNRVTSTGYVVDDHHASASMSNEVSRGSTSISLKGSRFLKPVELLLDEVFDVGMRVFAEKITPDSSLLEPDSLQNLCTIDDSFGESRRTKSRLISMLDEVYRSYKQCYQQIQAVVASFEYVSGLGNAAPYANLALKSMSKHFKCLKNAITEQLQFVNKPQGQSTSTPMFGSNNRAAFHDNQPVWRPQRGLPERAVTVLRAWLFEHFLHPYPTDADKVMLAKRTGLSRGQVSNWFINARVRIWKPMVEEIHMLEQARKGSQKDRDSTKSSDHLSSSTNSRAQDNNPSTSTQRAPRDTPSKRIRCEQQLSNVPFESSEPINLSYNNLSSSHPPHVDFGVSITGGVSNGVSLTLGLHQDNGISLSEPFPMNAAQRFSIGLSSEGYVIGGFEAQNRHLGKDVIGGQLMHDFVG